MVSHTLILTPWMSPHRVVSWTTAITLLFTGKINVLEAYDEVLGKIHEDRLKDFSALALASRRRQGDGLGDLIIQVPSVAMLCRPVATTKKGIKFSRINIYTRDGFRCQYCGQKKAMKDLNYDHVIPRKLGGKTDWTNIVTSCYACNDCKAGRTPEQAGMRLLKQPVRPKTLPMVSPLLPLHNVPEIWKFYLQGGMQMAATG